MKRVLDIAVAAAALALLAPLLAVLAALVWLEDRQAPFYRGPRMARGGATFRMLKFRSMRPDAARTGVSSTAAGDARITRVGAWLRRFKLDELPQFWNVLSGEMSLVGPRPQVPADASLYTSEEWRMLSVRPGMTDLASIVFADEASILAGHPDPDLLYNQVIRPWKSWLALLYVEYCPAGAALGIDLKVLLLTGIALVSRRRAIQGVERIVAGWQADELLLRMIRRREPLLAYPPPGATEIVSRYQVTGA